MTMDIEGPLFRISGEPQKDGTPPVLSVTFLRRGAGGVKEMKHTLIGTAGQTRWVVDLSSQGGERGWEAGDVAADFTDGS